MAETRFLTQWIWLQSPIPPHLAFLTSILNTTLPHKVQTMAEIYISQRSPKNKPMKPSPSSLNQNEQPQQKNQFKNKFIKYLSDKGEILCKCVALPTAHHFPILSWNVSLCLVPAVLADGFYFSISKAFRNLFLDFEACSMATSPHWWPWLVKKNLLSLCLFKTLLPVESSIFFKLLKSLGFRKRNTHSETLSASPFIQFLTSRGKNRMLFNHKAPWACAFSKLQLNYSGKNLALYDCLLLFLRFTGQFFSCDTYLDVCLNSCGRNGV